MNYNLIKITAEKSSIAIKHIAEEIGMSETGLHAAIRNETLKIRDLENIAKVLSVPVSTFFDDAKGSNIIGDLKDSTAVNSMGSNVHINTGNSKKEDVDIEKKQLRKNNLFYWDMIEHLVNNNTGLLVKIVEEAPQLQPFIAKQNEFKLFSRQLNTLIKLTDNNILLSDRYFDYFENPY